MAIKIPLKPVTKKTTIQVSAKPKVKTIGEVLDEYVDADKAAAKVREKIAALEVELQPLEAMRAAIADFIETAYKDEDADEEFVVEGRRSKMVIRKKGMKREIKDIAAIKKAMGTTKYMELAKVSLGDIDKYLTPEEQAKALKIERTKRTFAIEAKHPNA